MPTSGLWDPRLAEPQPLDEADHASDDVPEGAEGRLPPGVTATDDVSSPASGRGAPATERTGRVDAAASVVGTLVAQASGFSAGLLVVHSLGAEARGVMALVALTYRQAAVTASMGLDSALVHFGARAPNELKLRARRSLVIALGQGSIAALVGWIILKTFLAGSVAPAAGAVTIAALAAPAFLVLAYGTAALRGAGRLVEASVIDGVAAISTLAVIVGGVVTGSLWLAVVGAAAGVGLGAALSAVLVHRLPEPTAPPGPATWGRLLRYGLAGHVGTVFQNLNYRVDFYLVALLLTTSDVGVYALAVALAEALLLLPDALAAVVMQRAAASPRMRATEITLRAGLAAGAVGGVILAVASRTVVPIFFGSEFDAAPDAIAALLPGILALAVWKTLASDLAGRGFPLVKSTSAAVALAATVGGDLLLIPRYGIVGAAAASSIAYAAAAIVVARRYRLLMHRSLASILLGR